MVNVKRGLTDLYAANEILALDQLTEKIASYVIYCAGASWLLVGATVLA